MTRSFRRALGAVVLLMAFLDLGDTVSIVATRVGVRFTLPNLLPGSLDLFVGMALLLIVFFGLWRIARPGVGSKLILTGLVITALRAVALALGLGLGPMLTAGNQATVYALILPFNYLGPIAYLCMGVGLLIGSDLPSWVAWFAIVSAVLRLVVIPLPPAWPLPAQFVSLQHGAALFDVSTVVGEVFLFALGITLVTLGAGSGHASNKRIERTA